MTEHTTDAIGDEPQREDPPVPTGATTPDPGTEPFPEPLTGPERDVAADPVPDVSTPAALAVDEGSAVATDVTAVPEPADAPAPVADAAPVDGASVDSAPVEAAPVDAAPVDSVPVDTDTAPVDSAPVTAAAPEGTASVDSVPVEAAPVDAAPVDSAPAAEEPVLGEAPLDAPAQWAGDQAAPAADARSTATASSDAAPEPVVADDVAADALLPEEPAARAAGLGGVTVTEPVSAAGIDRLPGESAADTPAPASDESSTEAEAEAATAAETLAAPAEAAETSAAPAEAAETSAAPAEAAETSAAPAEAAETPADEAAAPEAPAPPAPVGEPAVPETQPADAPAVEAVVEESPAAEAPAQESPTALEDAAGDAAADPAAPAPTPAPTPGAGPRPTPRPTPRPVPRPLPRAPQAPTPAAGVPVAPVAPPQDAAEAAHATTFGRVDEEGTVYVREAAGERAVGQFPGATAEEALALYVRRYLDLHAKVVLFEARLSSADLPTKEVDQTLAKLTEELAEPAAVGDLDGLRTRLDALRSVAAERRAVAEAERAAAKEAAVAARTSIVEQAEKIAGTDPERIQWRPAGEQLRQLLDQWKDAQRNGPRLDRPTEEALWKRFSHARTTFDRERRHFFAELESRNATARAAKEALVAQAEKLATSTDWGATAGAYRDLMAQWKASGRASRKEDDALWARFRAAQDTFFAARDAASAETDAQFRGNLAVKEALLTEAERLLPITDLAAAKAALRSIQDRWDAAGKVPRGDLQRVEGRLRAVENAVRDADQSAWTRGNPETRARAEGAAAQLEAAISGLEADLAAAQAAGDARRIADAQSALDARRAWLEQVRRAAQGS